MKAKIYQPTKTAMQSGTAKTNLWVLEFVPEKRKYVEPIMGWTGSGDTKQQVRLNFESQEKAESYAKRQGIPYKVVAPKKRKYIKKSYADNFAYKND